MNFACDVPRTWKQCNDKKILNVYNEVIEEAERLGYKTNRPALFMYKSTCCWGKCRTVGETSTIGLNEVFKTDPEKCRRTCVHELAHALCPKDHHGYKWESIGNKIGAKWGIKMSRCSSSEDVGLSMSKKEDKNEYIVECPCCHEQWHYQRMTKVVQRPNTYLCPKCKQKLVRVK